MKAEAEVISKSEYKISVSAKRAKIYAISFSVIAFDLFRVKLSGSYLLVYEEVTSMSKMEGSMRSPVNS